MYLVDTNIWLERLLDQERAADVEQFLAQVTADQLAITDFTLHSIGIILTRFGRGDAFRQFVHDVLIEGGVALLSLQPRQMSHVLDAMQRFRLDFDDAYQCAAAEQAEATLVSFDEHFDRTDRGRQTPQDALTQRNS